MADFMFEALMALVAFTAVLGVPVFVMGVLKLVKKEHWLDNLVKYLENK